jgi:hypothetical protein
VSDDRRDPEDHPRAFNRAPALTGLMASSVMGMGNCEPSFQKTGRPLALSCRVDAASPYRASGLVLWPRLCEKSKTLDRERTSYSFKALSAPTPQAQFNFEIEPENIILVALRLFDFPHGLGHFRTHAPQQGII